MMSDFWLHEHTFLMLLSSMLKMLHVLFLIRVHGCWLEMGILTLICPLASLEILNKIFEVIWPLFIVFIVHLIVQVTLSSLLLKLPIHVKPSIPITLAS